MRHIVQNTSLAERKTVFRATASTSTTTTTTAATTGATTALLVQLLPDSHTIALHHRRLFKKNWPSEP